MKNKRLLSCLMSVVLASEFFCPRAVCESVKMSAKPNNGSGISMRKVGEVLSGVALGAVISGAVILGCALQTDAYDLRKNVDYKKKICNLDERLVWKMVIDGRYHSKGANICDVGGKITNDLSANAEPGYLNAMLKAFKYMVSTIDNEKLSADLFKRFHKETLTGVKISSERDYFNYRGDPDINCYFGISGTNSNRKGRRELSKKKTIGWGCERMMTSEIKDNDGLKLYGSKFSSVHEAERFVEIAFDTYYKKLEELKENGTVQGSWLSSRRSEEDKKLEIIIRICQCLDQAHTFYDGNIRTIVFLVMNKMLVENGLSPVVMFNPNCLDAMDVETLIGKIKKGQDEFYKIFVK